MARSRAGLGTVVALCAVLVLAGCGDDQIEELAADPMASTRPSGGELVTSREREAEEGGLLGKPSPARVSRIYAFESEAEARQGLSELQAAAEDVGWEVSSVAADGSGFSASRPMGSRTASLTVALNVDPGIEPAPGVFVALSSSDG